MQGIKMEVRQFGPDEAAELLEKNYGKNRHVRMSWVTQLAEMMRKGQYRGYNGETLIIHEDGTLLDGQHRLWAVIESGTVQDLVCAIVSGDKETIYRSIDGGSKRTTGDLIGGNNRNLKAAIARIACAIENGDAPLASAIQGKLGEKGIATRMDVIAYVDRTPELEQLTRMASQMRHGIGCGPGSIYGTFCFIVSFYGNPSKLEQFVSEAASPSQDDRTVAALVSLIRKSYLAKTSPTSKWLLGVLLNGYNHYLLGDGTVTLNKWQASFNAYDKAIKEARG